MAKLAVGLLGLLLLTAVPTAKCDLKKIVDGLFCPECQEILESDKVEDGRYCESCSEGMDEKPAEVQKIKVCVKEYYACPQCDGPGKAGDQCKDCEEPLEKRISKARILFACEKCGWEFEKEGVCDDEDCEKGKVVRTCSESGSYPHSSD